MNHNDNVFIIVFILSIYICILFLLHYIHIHIFLLKNNFLYELNIKVKKLKQRFCKKIAYDIKF